MFDKNQLVLIKWASGNKNKYIQLGYRYTGLGTNLTVHAFELANSSKEMVNVTCDYCGKQYNTQYSVISSLGKKHACSECAPTKANEIRRNRMAKEKMKQAEDICRRKGYKLVSKEEEYSGCKGDIVFECPIHGQQSMMLDNFLRGHECIKCSYKKKGDGLRYNVNEVRTIIESVDSNRLLNQNEYVDVFTNNLRVKCSCGNVYTVSLNNYMKRNQTRCSICSQKESVAEKRIREYLNTNGIEFEQEKRFDGCRDIKPLPFDFYLPCENLCIEFDGRHHYEPVFSKEQMERTQMHDKIKEKYCKQNGIKLIRISYLDGNNIETILENRQKI